MASLQTKTFTTAGTSLTTAFTSITDLLATSGVNMNVPEGYSKCVRLAMVFSADVAEATDGASVFKFAGDGVQVQQIFGGPGWCNQGVASLNGNNGQPVVIESAGGIFDVKAGNAIDISVGVTTAATADVSVTLTFA